MIKAELKNYRQSPRKVRLVADLIRGKKAEDALTLLTFTVKRSSDPIKKLLDSAIANAKHNFDISVADLFVKEIRVDEGPTLKRFRPRAFGRASTIRKRTSRILINLEKIEVKGVKKVEKVEKVEKTEEKKDSTPKTSKTTKTSEKKTTKPVAKKTATKKAALNPKTEVKAKAKSKTNKK